MKENWKWQEHREREREGGKLIIINNVKNLILVRLELFSINFEIVVALESDSWALISSNSITFVGSSPKSTGFDWQLQVQENEIPKSFSNEVSVKLNLGY